MSRKIPSGNGRKKPRSLPSNPRKKPVPGRHKFRRPGVEIPEVEVVKGIVPEKTNSLSVRILGSKGRAEIGDNMPAKWQLIIFLGQQTIKKMQETVA